MTPEEMREIETLFARGMPIRTIARKLGRNPKTIRRALKRPARKSVPSSKLQPFREAIRERVQKGLAVPRILREIRQIGYAGSRTILAEYVRSIRGPRRTSRKVFRRFETRPGEEGQVDWSPYRVKIAGTERLAHCFSMVLGYSRRMWIGFFRDERLPTLLFAHVEAFAYQEGLPRRLVYDNQTAVTLGRLKGEPLWNPTFLSFANYYGFKPYAHRPRHKERSGKVERPFAYVELDLLKGQEFESWEELNHRAREWLDTVANVRRHGTTGRYVQEAYAEERPLLIALPKVPFPAERREVRKVQKDGCLQVDGSYYPVPAKLVGQYVSVRISPVRVEVLDASGEVVAAHVVPDRPTRLPAEPTGLAPGECLSRPILEAQFLARFPHASDFLEGLKRRMKTLVPIHLRQIGHLAKLYGAERVAAAVERAQAYRNYNALAVQRILQRAYPDVVPEPLAVGGNPAALGALDEVDAGSPEDYPFDSMEATDGSEA